MRNATTESGDALARYREKRDFSVTPEPAPAPVKRAARKKKLAFVVQKHDARRLHYDVRLEIAGAMMSFAVPKGPSFDPAVKRLAVETEDHPMAYNKFEGAIPEGEYGGGDVIVWDRGTYETVPAGQEEAMRAKGHLHVRFFGEKLEGGFHFIRTRGRAGKPQWLMFKAKDEFADPSRDPVTERPESVKTGKLLPRDRGSASKQVSKRPVSKQVSKRPVSKRRRASERVLAPLAKARPRARRKVAAR